MTTPCRRIGGIPTTDGQRFLIQTDHQALSSIYSTTDSSGRLMRWRLRLSEYTFDMVFKPGASHHLPDFLSRASTVASQEDNQNDVPCLALAETANGLRTGRYMVTDTPEPVACDDVVEAQQTDDYCVGMSTRVQSRACQTGPVRADRASRLEPESFDSAWYRTRNRQRPMETSVPRTSDKRPDRPPGRLQSTGNHLNRNARGKRTSTRHAASRGATHAPMTAPIAMHRRPKEVQPRSCQLLTAPHR